MLIISQKELEKRLVNQVDALLPSYLNISSKIQPPLSSFGAHPN